MKVTVRNLGVIKEAEVDLKPLTIFVGPNNAGKTWLAYTLAGIFGSYGRNEYIRAYIEDKIPEEIYPPLRVAIQQIIDEGNATLDLIRFADEYGEAYFNNDARFAQRWMYKFMSAALVPFKDLDVSVQLAGTKAYFLEQIRQVVLKSEIAVGRRRKPLLTILKKRGEAQLSMYTSTESTSAGEQPIDGLPADAIKRSLVRTVLQAVHNALYPNVYTFPAERTAFVTRSLIHSNAAEALMEPLHYFLQMMKAAFETGSIEIRDREEEAKNDARIKTYIQLAQLLESQILNGKVSFSTREPGPGREILFTPLNEGILQVAAASSMVKELVSLVLYLRYFAKPGELLIIDEPEMNLHPEGQAKIIEFLSTLVNAGLRVLITTHSSYVVDHLINLMDAAKHENKQAIVNKFYLQRGDAFIAQDYVSVYLVDRGKAESILDEDGIIHWATFSDVSDRVMQLHFE